MINGKHCVLPWDVIWSVANMSVFVHTCEEEGIGGTGQWADLSSSALGAGQLGSRCWLPIGQTFHSLWGVQSHITSVLWSVHHASHIPKFTHRCVWAGAYRCNLSCSSGASVRVDTHTRSCPGCLCNRTHSCRCWCCTHRYLRQRQWEDYSTCVGISLFSFHV